MTIYTTLQRGFDHKLHCQDAFLTHQTDNKLFIALVADGCSGGIDSHFAAVLTCKLFRKLIGDTDFNQGLSPSMIGHELLCQYLKELSRVKQLLQLETEELLNTLLLAVWKNEQLWVSVLGDGVVSINQQTTIFDQNNQPDYPAYHLNDNQTHQQNYLHRQTLEFDGVKEFAIATDGILSFTNPEQPLISQHDLVLPYLLTDNSLAGSASMLSRKCNILQHRYYLQPADDLAIVRFCNS